MNKYEWRHDIGSKTKPSHAYEKADSMGHSMPVCGGGAIMRCTKVSDFTSKRLYAHYRCTRRLKIVYGRKGKPCST